MSKWNTDRLQRDTINLGLYGSTSKGCEVERWEIDELIENPPMEAITWGGTEPTDYLNKVRQW